MSEKFSSANLENMDPAEIIHHLSKLSYDAVQEAQPDKKHRPGFRSPYKDGWSPEAIAHQAHLRALIEIRRHVFGYHKRRKWTSNSKYFNSDIKRIVKAWRHKVIDKSKKIQNAWELMDKTGIGPQQLLTYTQTQEQNCVESQIQCVRNLLHGKLRSDLRLKISEAAATREKAVQEGKLTKAIKSITGQHQYFYNVDSLLLPVGTITTDPIKIHDMLTEAFAEHFICP